jgi:malate permease and related proteins
MLHIFETVLPIFGIILLGFVLNYRGILDQPFVRRANQVVFYIAIPAMLFKEIAGASFTDNFHLAAVFCLLFAIIVQLLLSLASARFLAIPLERRGTFLQSSFHGNLGYMAYAVAYYALGPEEFARTAILSSFLMVAQNILAVWVLLAFRSTGQEHLGKQGRFLLTSIYRNPIIIAVTVSMFYSALGLFIPVPIKRGLDILSGMALPTALLLIGASLSFKTLRLRMKELAGIGLLKLICFPLVGFIVMKLAQVPHMFILPGIILLASPPATVTYVMALELGGDMDLAASSISVLTLASALSYSLVLLLLM